MIMIVFMDIAVILLRIIVRRQWILNVGMEITMLFIITIIRMIPVP